MGFYKKQINLNIILSNKKFSTDRCLLKKMINIWYFLGKKSSYGLIKLKKSSLSYIPYIGILKMAQKLNIHDFELLQTLGTGSYGRVRLARNKNSGLLIAIKMLKKSSILRMKQVDNVISEFTILRIIRHPFLINLLGFSQDDRYLYFALEYIKGGELYMRIHESSRLEPEHAKLYVAQITLMFEYLHSINIIYRDLKPENLLINDDGYLKLIDFGYAKIVEGRTYTLCGTPEYLAPEILMNRGYGKSVDYWALGILIYEMLSGIDPFSDEDPMAVYQKILKGKFRFPIDFDRRAKSLVKHLLVADINKRYGTMKGGCEDIINHRWFEGLDWQKLFHKEIIMPYMPGQRNLNDTSVMSGEQESDTQSPGIRPNDDPFLDW
ncbi:unnamed protein product [Blepharisma stoltei]|uniref:cAMP-dependent protein kinase catalytic subunit n=1 Tax=Blepharisma stoltei TaxID=1481888 RepID=A0AAU9IZ35_9CILI|nr:unnamed protein product [Blepharisma stoltei]